MKIIGYIKNTNFGMPPKSMIYTKRSYYRINIYKKPIIGYGIKFKKVSIKIEEIK